MTNDLMTASCQSIEGKLMLWGVGLMRKKKPLFYRKSTKILTKLPKDERKFTERMSRSVPSVARWGVIFDD